MIRQLACFGLMFSASTAYAGLLVIDTDPIFPVPVFLDGVDAGITPVTITDCSPGFHRVEVRHPDFVADPKRVRCTSGLTEITIKLADLRWNLEMSSEPSGLVAYRGKEQLCVTPCSATQRGYEAFELRVESDDGLIRWRKRVKPKRNRTLKVHAAIKTGYLALKSFPESGQIWVNGKVRLSTTRTQASLGTHRLELESLNSNYQGSWEKKTVRLRHPGQVLVIEPPVIQRAPRGYVLLGSAPLFGRLRLRGGPVLSQRALAVTPGTHWVDLIDYDKKFRVAWRSKRIRIKDDVTPFELKPPDVMFGYLGLSGAMPHGAIVFRGTKQSLSRTGIMLKSGSYWLDVVGYPAGLEPSWKRRKVTLAKNGARSTIDPPTFTDVRWQVDVRSRPSGLNVFIDGQSVGRTPLQHRGASRGRLKVQVTSKGTDLDHANWNFVRRIPVALKAKKSVEAKFRHGYVQMRREAEHGFVTIQGADGTPSQRVRGKTVLAPGIYTVGVRGFPKEVIPNWDRHEVEIKGKEKVILLPALHFDAAPALFSVNTIPTGVKVVMDGRLIGETPLVAKPLRSGKHVMALRKPGYRILRRKIWLEPGEDFEKDYRLWAKGWIDEIPGAEWTLISTAGFWAFGGYKIRQAKQSQAEYMTLYQAGAWDSQEQQDELRELYSAQRRDGLAGFGLGLGVVGASTLAYFFLDRQPPPLPPAAEDDWMDLRNDEDARDAPSVAVGPANGTMGAERTESQRRDRRGPKRLNATAKTSRNRWLWSGGGVIAVGAAIGATNASKGPSTWSRNAALTADVVTVTGILVLVRGLAAR